MNEHAQCEMALNSPPLIENYVWEKIYGNSSGNVQQREEMKYHFQN